MAAKLIPRLKGICNGFVLLPEPTRHIRLSLLIRNIQTKAHVSPPAKTKSFFTYFKIATGLAVGTILLTFLYEDKRSRKLKRLAEDNPRGKYNVIADVVDLVADAVVHITMEEKSLFFSNLKGGSGFMIDSNGLIVTNAHVVGNHFGNNVKITLKDGRVFNGTVAAVSEAIDLALVAINGRNLPVLRLGSAQDLRPGEWVAAIGSPHFLTNSVTAGIVSSVHRTAAEIGLPDRNMKYIQTDTTVLHGNSGGPLVNLNGEVIGVNTMTVGPGISFAIPVEYVKHFLEIYQNRRAGVTAHRKYYMGISYLPLNQSTLEQLLLSGLELPDDIRHGMYIWEIKPGSPAHASGLCAGDVLYEVEGEKVYSVENLYQKFDEKETVTIRIYRKGVHYTAKLTPNRQIP